MAVQKLRPVVFFPWWYPGLNGTGLTNCTHTQGQLAILAAINSHTNGLVIAERNIMGGPGYSIHDCLPCCCGVRDLGDFWAEFYRLEKLSKEQN